MITYNLFVHYALLCWVVWFWNFLFGLVYYMLPQMKRHTLFLRAWEIDCRKRDTNLFAALYWPDLRMVFFIYLISLFDKFWKTLNEVASKYAKNMSLSRCGRVDYNPGLWPMMLLVTDLLIHYLLIVTNHSKVMFFVRTFPRFVLHCSAAPWPSSCLLSKRANVSFHCATVWSFFF
jgi:hypothetical protein